MVNTFIVSSDLAASAACLDNKRLWKQVLEADQIIKSLETSRDSKAPGGWSNHPAVKMWSGHVSLLKHYYNIHIDEWAKRGGRNNSKVKYTINEQLTYPWWWYVESVYYAYRANLLRKDPHHYCQVFTQFNASIPQEYIGKGYFWPTKVLSLIAGSNILVDTPTIVSAVSRLSLNQVLSPVQNDPICESHYKNGNKCMARAKRGSQYCGRHFK